MTQDERLDCMLRYLLDERDETRGLALPADPGEKRRLWRSLVNVRPPELIDGDYLRTEDAYLQEELRRKGVTRPDDLESVQPGLYLWQGDITTLAADAIVNAANSRMLGCFVPCHGCIDNAIHTAAGGRPRPEMPPDDGPRSRRRAARPSPDYQRPQPALQIRPAHGGADHLRGGDAEGPRPAGKLLPLLPGPGRPARLQERRLLLHLDRRVSFPRRAGRPDRHPDGAGVAAAEP